MLSTEMLRGAESVDETIGTELAGRLQEHGFDSRDDLLGAEEHGIEDVEPPADQVEDTPPEGMIERPGKDRANDGAQPNSTTGI